MRLGQVPHLILEEQVLQFDISVGDALGVQVVYRPEELADQSQGLLLGEVFPLHECVEKLPASADFEDHVDAGAVLGKAECSGNALPRRGVELYVWLKLEAYEGPPRKLHVAATQVLSNRPVGQSEAVLSFALALPGPVPLPSEVCSPTGSAHALQNSRASLSDSAAGASSAIPG